MADNGLAQAIFDCIENSTHQELFKPGDTLPDSMPEAVDIVLDDGSIVTVAAGDAIPVNSVSDVIVDELTGEASCISKSVVDQDLFLPGDNLPSDMAAPVTIVLDDGTLVTLNAGDPIPANSSSSVVVDEVTNQPACISKSVVDQDLFQPGDTLPDDMVGTVDVVLDDGTTVTLNPGDDVPANSTAAVYIDEVTKSPRCIGSKATKESILGDLPVGTCESVTDIMGFNVEGDCERYSVKDLIPVSLITCCEAAGEALTTVGTLASPEYSLSITEVAQGQEGTHIFSPPIESITTSPDNINMPAVINPDCVYALHVTYGGFGDGLLMSPVVTHTGGDLSGPASTPIYDQEVMTSIVRQSVFLFDGLANNGGDVVSLDFLQGTNHDADFDSVYQYFWTEICDENGLPLNSSDFGTAILSPTNVLQGENDGPYDTGDCDAVIFGAIRHVAHNSAGANGAGPIPTNGFDISNEGAGYTEVYDYTSFNNTAGFGHCNLGSTSGLMEGGSGPWTWTPYNQGAAGGWGAGLAALPLLACGPASLDTVDGQETCKTDSQNTNCLCDAVLECTFSGSVKLCASEGETIKAYPVVNGQPVLSQAVSASDGECIDHSISFTHTDPSVILPPNSAVVSTTSGWRFEGAGTYETTPHKLTCKVIPV